MRALVVGCGRIAGGHNRGPDDRLVLTHALAYTRHAGYRLAACVDPDAGTREEFSVTWNVPVAYASLDEALAADAYDIVSVCSPTGTHLPALDRLLASPVQRVFAEKPLDGDPSGARQMADHYAAAGRALAVNFTRRWDPEMQCLRDEIATGQWGVLQAVVGWYGRGVVNNGSHLIDLVGFLTGRLGKIEHIGRAQEDGVAGDPTIDAILDLDGAVFHLVGCDNRHHARFEATLSFSDGVIEILEGGLYVRRRPAQESQWFPGAKVAVGGLRQPTGYGVAMLRALDQLAAWKPGAPLASDAASSIPAIALAVDIRAGRTA